MEKIPRITQFGLSVLLPLFGCVEAPEGSFDGPNDDLRSTPRPIGDDLGERRFASAPNYHAAICPDGASCSTIDVNHDGREDLVRFDPLGLAGPPGRVSVAYSNGWNFGPMQPLADDFCVDNDACLATDVTGDDRPDLIRFDRELGEVHIAASQPDGLFASPVLYAKGLCGVGQNCTAGDVTGDGRADLVAFTGPQDQKGYVRVYPAELGVGGQALIMAEGLCTSAGALCRLGDVDGDARVDLIELRRDASGQVDVLRSLGQSFAGKKTWATGVCPSGALCELRDFNGDFLADVIARVPEVDSSNPDSCSGACGDAAPNCYCDELCTQYGDCCADYQAICVNGATCEGHCGGGSQGCYCDELCTQYGDCCSDYEAQCVPSLAHDIEVSVALIGGFAPPLMLSSACEPGHRCWTADVTGDGRADLLTLDPAGVLELFPSQDTVDRMEDAALRLSMLRTDFERRRRVWEQRELDRLLANALPVSPVLAAALPHRFPAAPPPASPTPSDPALPIEPLPGLDPWPTIAPGAIDPAWMLDEAAVLGAAIELEAAAILDAVPSEGGLVWTADQQRWLTALGRIVAARTAVYAPALAASSVTRGRCHNAILHDRIEDDDGVVRVEGSYFARFFGALLEHDPDDRVRRALPALTGIVEGLRCLSEPELAGLEAGYVEAVTTTMQDLLDRGQPLLAKLVWDQALPIELILFDGVKHYAPPQGWRLLQVRIEGTTVVLPELPDPGSDFAQYYVEDGATCSTVRCQLYKTAPDSGGERQLTLDTLGAWLPDLSEREQLRQSTLHPHNLLDALVDLRHLGEGDCALIELNMFNRTCKSRRTCELADELAAMPNELDLLLSPGDPASPFTHFGTERASLDTVNGCGSSGGGGGAPPSTCMGPELRGHGGRFFPLDPELDRIMNCTLESFTASEPTISIVPVDMQLNPACLLMDPDNDPSPPLPGTVEANKENLEHNQSEAGKFFATGDGEASTRHGYDREQVITAIVDKTGATREQVIKAMEVVGNEYLAGTGFRALNNGHPMGTYVARDGAGQLVGLRIGVDPVVFNRELAIAEAAGGPEAAHEYMMRGMLHEGVHMVLRVMEDRGWGDPAADLDAAHAITDRLGLVRVTRSCDLNSSTCRSGCGFSDARIQRFSECIDAADPTPISRCELAEDYCTERSLGVLDFDPGSGCDAPTISFPPMCAVVSCDTGSAIATACCGDGGGGGGTPPPFPNISPTPGPCPGDPDAPYGGIPGGPGGIPLPPFPSFPLF